MKAAPKIFICKRCGKEFTRRAYSSKYCDDCANQVKIDATIKKRNKDLHCCIKHATDEAIKIGIQAHKNGTTYGQIVSTEYLNSFKTEMKERYLEWQISTKKQKLGLETE